MCMTPGCIGSKSKSSTYTPKKSGGSKGSYAPKGRATVMSSFGKPQVRVSFSGKK